MSVDTLYSALPFGKLDALSIAGMSQSTPVPAVTNPGLFFLIVPVTSVLGLSSIYRSADTGRVGGPVRYTSENKRLSRSRRIHI